MTITALTRCAKALLAAQDVEGRWADYPDLPVGASDGWVTAYVALSLTECAPHLPDLPLRPAAERAYKVLTSRNKQSAGLGYNEGVSSDADSTATLLLLADALGLAPDVRDIDFLLAHQRQDCGFATFLRDDGWGASHNCVTPVAVRALLRVAPDRLAQGWENYCDAARRADGFWDAYWWPHPFYATAAWLRLAHETRHFTIAPPVEAVSFEIGTVMDLALAIEIARYWQLPCCHLIEGLLRIQKSDGLWPPSCNLRVTDPSFVRYAEADGEIYADTRGFLTSATALRVLAMLLTEGAVAGSALSPENLTILN